MKRKENYKIIRSIVLIQSVYITSIYRVGTIGRGKLLSGRETTKKTIKTNNKKPFEVP